VCPEATVVDAEHALTRLSTECCVNGAHPQRLDVIAICSQHFVHPEGSVFVNFCKAAQRYNPEDHYASQ
jgi:hypothetical protein